MNHSLIARLGKQRRALVNVMVVLIITYAALVILAQYSFLLAHAIAEMYSVAVAVTITFIAWNAREYFDNGYLVFLGIAYFFVGSLDLLHTVAYKGMGYFTEYGANLPTQLWVLSRYVESISLAAALLFVSRPVRPYRAMAAYGLITAAGIAAVFGGLFPDCFLPESGLTAFKRISEYVIAAILAGTIWGVYRLRHRFEPRLLIYLYASLVMTILAEMTFTAYISVYGFSNLLGHYFKVISFYLIYRGVVVTGIRDPYALLMQRLQERNRELEESRETIWRNQKISATMLNNIPEEIALLDAETLEIVDVNRTFLEDYGISREEAIGRTCHKVTHGREEPCNSADHLCPLYHAQYQGQPIVHCHRDKNGEQHYVEIYLIPVEEEEGRTSPRQYVHISRDITERKRTEQMREDIERVVRHDLKSPLNGIIGGAQLLLQDDNLSEEQREMLSAVYDSGMSVLQMVNQSLNMYKMAEGSYQLKPEMVNLAEVLRRLTARWQAKRTSKHIDLRILLNGTALEEAQQFYIFGEQQNIEQLLANLIENAIDASPRQSPVTLRAEKDDRSVLIDIHNYGTIPEEVRPRFFERYVTHGKRRGTGLGTYSAWLITRAHGGSIDFTTDEQEGTHVRVTLPCRLDEDNTASPQESGDPPEQGG